MKAGDKVIFMDVNLRGLAPDFYPPVGTIGTVIDVDDDGCLYVQWPRGGMSDKDCWWVTPKNVELEEEAKQ